MGSTATETVVALRWRDMDAYGHVNHVVYLTYLEEGRDAAIARILRETPGEGGYVVARVAIDYRRELRLADGPVVVSCTVTTIGGVQRPDAGNDPHRHGRAGGRGRSRGGQVRPRDTPLAAVDG